MVEKVVVEYAAPIVNKLPYLDLSGIFSQHGVQTVIDIMSSISYLFPWKTVLSIVGFMVGIYTIRIIIAFLKALWGILPIA